MRKDNKVILNNPKILEWAREEVCLTIPDVARRFKKHEATIEAWETPNSTESPTFRQLVDLANYYKRPVATFFLPILPPKSPKPDDYRTLPYISHGRYIRETLLAYREMSNMLSFTRELFGELNIQIVFSLPIWTMHDDPELKAKELRELLGISVEKQIKQFHKYKIAEDTWRDALFNRGVVVRICAMPISDARAFCLLGDNLAGIGLSNEDREHGRIFSLFHEVCHLSLKQPGVTGLTTNRKSPNQQLEQYCNHFAASFLLPASHPEVNDSLQLFKGSTIDYLDLAQYVANKFKVSKYVVIRRAFDLQFITPNVYWQIIPEWKELDAKYAKSRKRKGGNRNMAQMNNIGKRFITLVMQAIQRDYLTPFDARRILGVDPSYIELNM